VQAQRLQNDIDARQARANVDINNPSRRSSSKSVADPIQIAQEQLALDEARNAQMSVLKADAAKLKALYLAQSTDVVSRTQQALQATGVDAEVANVAAQRASQAKQKTDAAAATSAAQAQKAAAAALTADNDVLAYAQTYAQTVQQQKGSVQQQIEAARGVYAAQLTIAADTTKAGTLARQTAELQAKNQLDATVTGIKSTAAADAQAAQQAALAIRQKADQARLDNANADLTSAGLSQQAAQLNKLSSAKQIEAARLVDEDAKRVADLTTKGGSKQRANAYRAADLQLQGTVGGINAVDTAKAQADRAAAADVQLTAAQLYQSSVQLHHGSALLQIQAANRTYEAALLQIKASGATGQDAANQREAARQARDQTNDAAKQQAAQAQLHELQNRLSIDQAKAAGKGTLNADEARLIAYELGHLTALGLTRSDVALQQAQYAQNATQQPKGPGLNLAFPTGLNDTGLSTTRGGADFRLGIFPQNTTQQLITSLERQLDLTRQQLQYALTFIQKQDRGNEYLATIAHNSVAKPGIGGGSHGFPGRH